MDYDIYQALGGVNVKYLANDKLLFHGNFAQFFYVLFFGLIWGYVYYKSGKIIYVPSGR